MTTGPTLAEPQVKATAVETYYARRLPLPRQVLVIDVTYRERYFEPIPPREAADVRACLFSTEPVSGWRQYSYSTRLIDLAPESDAIFAGFSKDTRYDINRAQRDGVEASVRSAPTREELQEFMYYYDAFAASKGVPGINRPQVSALHALGNLALSVARSSSGATLASHAYIVDQSRVRLTHSPSLFRLEKVPARRAQIGRANRLPHWTDLDVFRRMGATVYDFGGWYEGSSDQSLLRINAFKGEFGGELAPEWSSFAPGTPLGWIYLTLRDVRLRMKS